MNTVIDQMTKREIQEKEPEYRRNTQELSDHLRHLKAKTIIENQIFQRIFQQDAYFVRERFNTQYKGRQEDIINANAEASDKFYEAFANDLLEEVLRRN